MEWHQGFLITYVMNKIALTLSLISIAAIGGPLALLFAHHISHSGRQGFERKMLAPQFAPVHFFETDFDMSVITYFEGSLFANNSTSREIVELDTTGKVLAVYSMGEDESNKDLYTMGVSIDSESLHLIDPRTQVSLRFNRGELDEHRIAKVVHTTKIDKSFRKGFFLGEDQYMLVTPDKEILNNQLELYNSRDTVFQSLPEALEKYDDRGFATDGFFVRGFQNNHFYLLQLMGKFLCFDMNGRVKYHAQTIDGKQHPPKIIKEKEMFYLPAEVKTVNLAACTDEKFLYVVSLIKADNESSVDFRKFSVVDQYNTSDGTYAGSFYLPNVEAGRVVGIAKSAYGIYAMLTSKKVMYCEKVNQ